MTKTFSFAAVHMAVAFAVIVSVPAERRPDLCGRHAAEQLHHLGSIAHDPHRLQQLAGCLRQSHGDGLTFLAGFRESRGPALQPYDHPVGRDLGSGARQRERAEQSEDATRDPCLGFAHSSPLRHAACLPAAEATGAS